MGIASQEYRDGASTGAHEVRDRLLKLDLWGVLITRAIIDAVAEGVCAEWGGIVKEPDDSEARS